MDRITRVMESLEPRKVSVYYQNYLAVLEEDGAKAGEGYLEGLPGEYKERVMERIRSKN